MVSTCRRQVDHFDPHEIWRVDPVNHLNWIEVDRKDPPAAGGFCDPPEMRRVDRTSNRQVDQWIFDLKWVKRFRRQSCEKPFATELHVGDELLFDSKDHTLRSSTLQEKVRCEVISYRTV